jgi:hypothetical protein
MTSNRQANVSVILFPLDATGAPIVTGRFEEGTIQLAAMGTMGAGAILGVPTAAGLATVGGTLDVAQQTAAEGQSLANVDYGRSFRTAGLTATGGVLLGPTIGAASPWISVPGKTAAYGLATYGAVEAGRDIGQGSAEGSVARVLLGTAKGLFSLAGGLATAGASPSITTTVAESSRGKAEMLLERKLALNPENDFSGDGFPTHLGRVEGRTYFRENELINADRSPIAEFDVIDLKSRTFYEDKKALGFGGGRAPLSDKALEREISTFLDKKVITKATDKINALSSATGIRPNPNGQGTATTPSLDSIQGIRNMTFRFEGNHPELQRIMIDRLQQLQKKHPDYEFEAKFGYKQEDKQ